MNRIIPSIAFASLLAGVHALANEAVPLRTWGAPAHWQPTAVSARPDHGRTSLGTAAAPSPSPLPFIAISPCRVVDTRSGIGPYQGPILAAASSRTFDIKAGPCSGIPASAAAYSLSITVTESPFANPGSFLTAWPAGEPTPNVSTLNYATGQTIANAAIVSAGAGGAISVLSNASTHLIIDINGFYAPPPSAVASGAGINPLRVALLRWYEVNQARAAFPLGVDSAGVAVFDGAHIWVTSPNLGSITRLRVSDGATVGTFAAGPSSLRAAFDGASIWVTNFSENTVTRLRASDGVNTGVFPAGANPAAIAFDGASLWVVNGNEFVNTVTKIRAMDGARLGTYPVGTLPMDVAFDGANVWIASSIGGTLTRLRASDGTNLGSIGVIAPSRLVFDGTSMWAASAGGQVVTKVRASDAAILGTYPAGFYPSGLAFDGSSIWVADGTTSVMKLRASDGASLGIFEVGSQCGDAVFDGANVWVVHTDGKVSKL